MYELSVFKSRRVLLHDYAPLRLPHGERQLKEFKRYSTRFPMRMLALRFPQRLARENVKKLGASWLNILTIVNRFAATSTIHKLAISFAYCSAS